MLTRINYWKNALWVALLCFALLWSVGCLADLDEEETKAWIEAALNSCGETDWFLTPLGEEDHLKLSVRLKTKIVFDGNELQYTATGRETFRNESTGNVIGSPEKAIGWSVRVSLSELTPKVETVNTGVGLGTAVVLQCGTSATCFYEPDDDGQDGVFGHFFNHKSRHYLFLFVCQPERVANALSHLITLYGGEESPF